MSFDEKMNRYCTIAIPFLIIAIILSLFAIVFMKDLNRRQFIRYQGMEQVQNQLDLDWGKLLLEQSTLTTQSRVEAIAETQLNMVDPDQRQVLVLHREKSDAR